MFCGVFASSLNFFTKTNTAHFKMSGWTVWQMTQNKSIRCFTIFINNDQVCEISCNALWDNFFQSQSSSVINMWIWYNCWELLTESNCSPMRSIWRCDKNLRRRLSVEVRSKFIRRFIVSHLFIIGVYCGLVVNALVVNGLGNRLWWSLIAKSLSLLFKFFS